MKKSNRLQNWLKTAIGAVVLLAVLTVGMNLNSFVSLADSAGKVTVDSAKVRKEASTTSETVGSVLQGTTVSVTGQTTGSDGYTWYKVSVDGGIVGYIRSDLMEITDGSTPASVVTPTTTTSTPTTSTPDEPLVDVAEVEPVSASVSGGSPVRVRQNASTTSRIVTTAQSGLALTVIGQATGTDNKEWYQVNFISNGSEVSGFIRADYVTVSGELVPAGSGDVQEPVEVPETTEPEPVEETKDWETYYDTKWHLLDNTTGNSYDIEQIFSSVEANTQTLQDVLKENKTQQVIIIILVILVILLGTGISFLIFKLKDMMDSAYYNEVEQETMRRRTADRPVSKPQNGQRVMQTVGAEGSKRPAGQGAQRPAGQGAQRPAGQGTQRPAGQGTQRPAGQGTQRPAGQGTQRPAGQGTQRPAGQGTQRPAGQRPTGARPAGQGAYRPAGQRPTGARPAGQGAQRPVGQSGQRPAGAQPPVKQRPVQPREVVEELTQEAPQELIQNEIEFQDTAVQSAQPADNAAWQSRNFANEDEFEFQFLDWNEEE